MKVKFLPMNVELEIRPGQSVMDLAHENKIFIKSVCNGLPSCAECRVKVVEGEANVLPPSTKELSLIGTGYFIDQRRLSCQLQCYGDITVDLSEQVAKQNEGPRRPQGLKKAEVTSHAVTGNLLDQDKELVTQVAAPQEESGERPQGRRDRRPNEREFQRRDNLNGQRSGAKNRSNEGGKNKGRDGDKNRANENNKSGRRRFRFRPGQKN